MVVDSSDEHIDRDGRPSCDHCGSLVCIAYKPDRPDQTGHFGSIGSKATPEPASDIIEVLCAACGETIWEKDL